MLSGSSRPMLLQYFWVLIESSGNRHRDTQANPFQLSNLRGNASEGVKLKPGQSQSSVPMLQMCLASLELELICNH